MTASNDRSHTGSIEAITSVQRRRRWSTEKKRAVLEEAELPYNSISSIARKHGICPNLLFRWRRLMREGALVASGADKGVVPVSEMEQTKAGSCA